MKETRKQYIRLLILGIIVMAIILYEPISSGQIFQGAEKLDMPLSITLDGVEYAFSTELTVAEFEKNGWTLVSYWDESLSYGDNKSDKKVKSINEINITEEQHNDRVIPPYKTAVLSYTKTP